MTEELIDGDMYFCTSNASVWYYENGAWSLIYSLTGSGTVTVTDPDDLGSAIEEAGENGVVSLGSGDGVVYTLPEELPAGVSIVGDGNTVVDMSDGYTLTSDDVSITGVNVIGNGEGGEDSGTLVIDGARNVTITDSTFTDGPYATVSGHIFVKGADSSVVIENCTVTDAFRAVYVTGSAESVTIRDSYLDAVYPLNCSGTTDCTLTVENTTLRGWTSYSLGTGSATFTNCEFDSETYVRPSLENPEEDPVYAHLRPYDDTVFTNCTFSSAMTVDCGEAGITVTFDGCEYAGEALTTASLLTMMGGGDYIQSVLDSTWIVDGETLDFTGVYSDEWSSDITGHWHAAYVGDGKIEEAAHSCGADNLCTVCEYDCSFDNAVSGNSVYIYTADAFADFAASVNAGNNYSGYTVYLMNDIDLGGVAGYVNYGVSVTGCSFTDGAVSLSDKTPDDYVASHLGNAFVGGIAGEYAGSEPGSAITGCTVANASVYGAALNIAGEIVGGTRGSDDYIELKDNNAEENVTVSAFIDSVSLYSGSFGGKWRSIEVSTAEALMFVNEYAGEYIANSEAAPAVVAINADIDLAEYTWQPLNGLFVDFDGNGHTVSNLVCGHDDTDRSGLFGYASGTISDLTLNNVTASGSQAGAFAGIGHEGLVLDNCTLTGTVVVSYEDFEDTEYSEEWNGVAALVGISASGYSYVTVTADADVTIDYGDMTTAASAQSTDVYTRVYGFLTGSVTLNQLYCNINGNMTVVGEYTEL